MKSASGNEKSVFGWVAYAVLALMLGAPLLEWLQRTGMGVPLGLLVLGFALWLLRRPVALLGLWLGLSL